MVEAGNLPPPAPPPPIPDEVKFQMETARFIFFGVASVLMTIKLTTFADGSKTSFLWTSIALLTITLIISLFTNVLGMYFYNLPPYPKWVKILNSCSYTLVTLAAILSLGA